MFVEAAGKILRAKRAGETTGRDPGEKTSGISALFGRARAPCDDVRA